MFSLLQQDIITGVRFAGALDMFIIAIAMMIVYRGKVQSKTYNVARWLLVFGTLMLAMHNAIQFVGHFREESPTTAWAINVLFYAFTASMYGLAELNLLRAGHKMRLIYWVNIGSLLLILLLFGIGALTDTLVNDAAPWRTTTFGMAIVYTACLVFMNIRVGRDLRAANSVLSDDELHERHRVLAYTGRCMHGIMIVSLLTPWAGMSSSLVLHALMGTVVFVLFIWYLAAFIIYGHDMAEVIEVENELYMATLEPAEVKTEEERVAEAIARWVEGKHYLDPNLTIKNALDAMGIGPDTLNDYLQTELSIPGYRQWIPYLRIEEAKRLIRENPNYTLDTIADMCGLSNGSALARTFRAQTGMTPTQWAASAMPK